MRILMFGWEFPPRVSGGLGTACHGIVEGLLSLGHQVTFLLPRADHPRQSDSFSLLSAAGSEYLDDGSLVARRPSLVSRYIPSSLRPYFKKQGRDHISGGGEGSLSGSHGAGNALSGDYGPELLEEVFRYARVASAVALESSFSVIHAHDWMTFPAGVATKEATGKPLIVHVHALEYDRSGEQVNPAICEVEQYGMERADHVVAVSHYTKTMICQRYRIPPGKVSVVYNAVTRREAQSIYRIEKDPLQKMVLYLGRITFQKGPDYFVDAAERVLEVMPEVTFVMAGAGDMMSDMVERVAAKRIGQRFHFTGFLGGDEVEKIYAQSDLYVMPSVSEPFGIAPLEAMSYDVPVIISKQSGVSEVLPHALKVDFWDVDQMAELIVVLLKDAHRAAELVEQSRKDLEKLRWEDSAARLLQIYRSVLS